MGRLPLSQTVHPPSGAIADEPQGRRCAECGALEDDSSRRAAGRGGRVVLLSTLTVLVAALVVAAIVHRGRERFRIGSGIPVGRSVSPAVTWDDVRKAAAGDRAMAPEAAGARSGESGAAPGLFAAVFGIGEGWSWHVPAELRLWSEFTAVPNASDLEYLRGGKGAVEPLRWTEVQAMRLGPSPDEAMARRLVEIHRDRAIDPSATLKITPDPGVLMNGEVTTWSVWLTLASATRMRYVRDDWFGPSQPVAPEPRVRIRPGLPVSSLEIASADPGRGVLTIELDLRGVAVVLAGAGVLGVLAWFTFGGLRARRLRQRALRGECLRCGYQLAPR